MKKVHIILVSRGISPTTLVEPMAEMYDLDKININELFRELNSEQSEISRKVKKYLDSGELIPDHLITEVIEQKIKEVKKDFQLIRYPRTKQQYQLLEQLFANNNIEIECIWFLKLRDIEQMISYKKENESEDPYVKKFGVNEEIFRKNYHDSIQEFEAINQYVNNNKLVEIIEFDYPIELNKEEIKKHLTKPKLH